MPRRVTPRTPLALTLVLVMLAAGACRLPDLTDDEPREIPLAQTSIVYAADGSVLTTLHAEQDRTLVPVLHIPKHMRHAVVAIEDSRFFEHRGVDLKAVMRALYVNATEGAIVEGGSTITQQYVKNVLTGGERTLNRKLREARLAWELEQKYPKLEILGKYLNTVYFGDGAYGVEAAAHHYFSRDASELTLAQSATLAGVIAAPTDYDPIDHPQLAVQRRNLVLRLMREQGYITRAQEELTAASKLGLKQPPEKLRYPAAYFVDYVRRQVIGDRRLGETRAEREQALYTGGLRIYTTLDPRLQGFAESAVRDVLTYGTDPYGAMTVVDPRTGHIKAMVGGRDFFSRKDPVAKVNLATADGAIGRSAGSSFKPFGLITALERGIPPDRVYTAGGSMVLPLPGGGSWPVQNYDGSGFGSITLEQATINSVNVVYAQLVQDLGDGDPFFGARLMNDTARRMGIRSKLHNWPSTILGTNPVNPLEMASAYGTLATNGAHTRPIAITRIQDAAGNVLAQNRPRLEQVVNPAVAWVTTEILKKVVQSGTGTAAALDRPAAGKTGTGQEWRDAWFAGYVPQLAAAVWVGFPQGGIEMVAPRTRLPHVTGGSWPAQIWHAFMVRAVQGLPAPDFPRPQFGYITVKIDFTRGCLPNQFTPPQVIREVRYPAGTQPRERCTEPKEPQLLPVPSVVGLSLEEAQATLQANGFGSSVNEEYAPGQAPGSVLSQDPGPGQDAYMGTAIDLVVATEVVPKPSPGSYDGTVPEVVGMARADAIDALEARGFEVEVVTEWRCEPADPDCEADPGRVWTQNPTAGKEAEEGSTVTIWVNPETAPTPDG
jgi:penicillin-binding protein 1A